MKNQTILPSLPAQTDRILIIGCAGSGKSTLSVQLGTRLRLPVIHLDRIYWQTGWNPVSNAEFDRQLAEVLDQERWILDGNYSRTFLTRFEACDAAVFLDFPRLICLKNVFARYLRYHGRTRPDLPEGCPESLDWEFLVWIWNFNKTHRQRYYDLFGTHGKPVVILRSRQECDEFLSSLSTSPS
ncbi:MAG: topology modulation protein [Anaerolineaceae bacterium]|jgi:adenylate kinase family enzyme